MGSIIENVKTVNSAARTLLLAALVAGVGLAAYMGYSEYTKNDRLVEEQEAQLKAANQKLITIQGELDTKVREVETLTQEVAERDAQIERLETAMHLLKTDQRLARLNVLEIQRDDEGNAVSSKLEFVELSPQGEAFSPPKQFELPGDVVYIDNWVIKFDDAYIERGDVQRGTSLCLFRRIFSEQQMPTEGVSLDEIGMRPQAYARGGVLTEFEQQLWTDFWEFANDPSKAAKLGIRAANGEAISIKVREGKAYGITLRSSGGLSIKPIAASRSDDDAG